MFRLLFPFIVALFVFVMLQTLPQNTDSMEQRHPIWQSWQIKPHLYRTDNGEGGILLINFSKLVSTPEQLPQDGYKVTLRSGNDELQLQHAETVKVFDGERLFYVIKDSPLLKKDSLNVAVKVGNQPEKQASVTPKLASPLLMAAMLGQADKLQDLTSSMEDSADKFFYAAIADELQHKSEEAAASYEKALSFTNYRNNEMPNMLLFKRYEALK